MDSAYPFGNYVLSAHNSGTSANQSATISYAADEYESAVLAFAAATFAALQGLNPASAFTLNFNSFTDAAGANEEDTFLTIYGSSYAKLLSGTRRPPAQFRRIRCCRTPLTRLNLTSQIDFEWD